MVFPAATTNSTLPGSSHLNGFCASRHSGSNGFRVVSEWSKAANQSNSSAEHKVEHNKLRMRGPEPNLEAAGPTVSPCIRVRAARTILFAKPLYGLTPVPRVLTLPLRQIFLAFISNHLQGNSQPKRSAYGFQATLVEFEVGQNVVYCNALRRSFISNIKCNSWLGDASKSKCS